jgi:hypothetical protein
VLCANRQVLHELHELRRHRLFLKPPQQGRHGSAVALRACVVPRQPLCCEGRGRQIIVLRPVAGLRALQMRCSCDLA